MKFAKKLKSLCRRNSHATTTSTRKEKSFNIISTSETTIEGSMVEPSTWSLSVQRPSTLGLDLSPFKAAMSLVECHDRWVQQLIKNPDLKVAVVGGGIYGCHFANVFQKACEEVASTGSIEVTATLTIFEKDSVLFSQASGKNSFRIHKGFHYPRTGNTRRMCYDDHNRFCQLYPNFFQMLDSPARKTPAFAKVFAIAKDDKTRIDYEAMRNLLAGAKYQGGKSMWEEIDGELWNEEIRQSPDALFHRQQMEKLGFNVDLIDGAFLVQAEPILYADRPRKWFTERFTKSPFVRLEMGRRVDRSDIRETEGKAQGLLIHEEFFDLALNCTYNQAIPMQPSDHKAFYDLCISVIIAEKPTLGEAPAALSFGIFDGPFPSLEPYDFEDASNLPTELQPFGEQNLFQIFDVQLSSIGQRCDPTEAYEFMADWEAKKRENSEEYQKVVQDIWNKCELYFPRLGVDFELAGTWFALKTKVEDENASRPVIVVPDESVDRHGRFVQVFSSKLTSIFKAEEGVLDLMETDDEESEAFLEEQDTFEPLRMCA